MREGVSVHCGYINLPMFVLSHYALDIRVSELYIHVCPNLLYPTYM